ncbi:MAG: calmodulin-binding protein [Planctomycetota bacterium]
MRRLKALSRIGDSNSRHSRGEIMLRRAILVAAIAFVASVSTASVSNAQQPSQQQAYGRSWGNAASSRDYSRFNHYPYVYYPQNFYGNDYYRSSDSLYHRYVPEMQIPVYNRQWYNYYPMNQRYHWGHHNLTDVF